MADISQITLPNGSSYYIKDPIIRQALLPPYTTVTGDEVNIEAGSNVFPAKSIMVTIVPSQAGSGDPSPSNSRAISGYSSATLTVTNGKESTDEDYDENEYTVEFLSTIYGGTFSFTNGNLLTTMASRVLYGFENEWTFEANNHRAVFPCADVLNTGRRVKVICNIGYLGSDLSQSTPGTVFASGTNFYYYPPLTVTSLQDFRDWMDSLPVPLHIVYPKNTESTVQYRSNEIRLFLGDNTIWSNAGEVTVKYGAEIQQMADLLAGLDIETSSALIEPSDIDDIFDGTITEETGSGTATATG